MEITYKTTVINYPGMTVRVQRPELTAEERARRMKQIKNAVADLLRG